MHTEENIGPDLNFKILKKYLKDVIGTNFKIEFGPHGYSQSTNSNYFSGWVQLPSQFISYNNTDY